MIDRGAQWSDSPLVACPRVIISLYTTDVVADVLAGLDAELHEGLVPVDTTTGEPGRTETGKLHPEDDSV